MDKFNDFRNKYSEFYYNNYFIEENDNYIKITYEFEIKDLEKFTPTLKIPVSKNRGSIYAKEKIGTDSIITDVIRPCGSSYPAVFCSFVRADGRRYYCKGGLPV